MDNRRTTSHLDEWAGIRMPTNTDERIRRNLRQAALRQADLQQADLQQLSLQPDSSVRRRSSKRFYRTLLPVGASVLGLLVVGIVTLNLQGAARGRAVPAPNNQASKSSSVTGVSTGKGQPSSTSRSGSSSSSSTGVAHQNVSEKGVGPTISRQEVQTAQSTVNELVDEVNQLN